MGFQVTETYSFSKPTEWGQNRGNPFRWNLRIRMEHMAWAKKYTYTYPSFDTSFDTLPLTRNQFL